MPKFSRYTFVVLVFWAVFSGIIANSRPLWCRVDGQSFFPAFKSILSPGQLNFNNAQLRAMELNNDWAKILPKDKIMPLIGYSAGQQTIDKKMPPFSPGTTGGRHWLGTDIDGRDVAASAMAGARTALMTALLAMLISLFIGGVLGAVAGYFGDYGLRVQISTLIAWVSGLSVFLFLTFLSRKNIAVPEGMSTLAFLKMTIITAVVFTVFGWILSKVSFLKKKVSIPADIIVSRLAEITSSIPLVIILLSISAIMNHRTLMNMVALIGCLLWPGTAGFLRAELLKIRQMEYISAAKGLGIPEWRIILYHALPNAVRPLMVAFSLGAGMAVLIEALLAFLNVGTYSPTQITWGQMLHSAKNNIELWWVWLTPGLIICFLVGALFEWSEYMNAKRR